MSEQGAVPLFNCGVFATESLSSNNTFGFVVICKVCYETSNIFIMKDKRNGSYRFY